MAVPFLYSFLSCGLSAQHGDCGDFLSTAECDIVRTQLGKLEPRPPADASNRFGQCLVTPSQQCVLEDAASELGRRLFFDRCLSSDKKTACVACHAPAAAFADNRSREITALVKVAGVDTALPLIVDPTPERVAMPPPLVQAQLDPNGVPLARWDGSKWVPVVRRPQASVGSGGRAFTARHSPTLVNFSYGAAVPNLDGSRTYGGVWTPWDGRYDSAWALVADVFEFGATQNTDRANIAVRMYRKHKAQYEKMISGTMPNIDEQVGGKYVYLRHGSPSLASNKCWYQGSDCATAPNDVAIPPTPQVLDNINHIFVDAGKALAAYMRRLRSSDSPYDKWLAGDPAAMSPAAQRGLRLFIGKAECILCHNGPNFTDYQFHNLGVPEQDPERKTAGSAPAFATQPSGASNPCFDGLGPLPACPDPGREGWQLRASGQCERDSIGVNNVTVNCQRVDFRGSANRSDITTDCRGTASDVPDKDKNRLCERTNVRAQSRCDHSDSASCEADPLCRWWSAPPDTVNPPPPPRCLARSTSLELGQFKTPTLRNIALTFPYMHNGALYDYGPAERGETHADDSVPHLIRVIEFYNQGGGIPVVGTLDRQIHPLHLSKSEVADLVEFLKALTDMSILTKDPEHLTVMPADLEDVSDCPP